MNCQFCEDYEWSKKHRPKTGRELYTKYYVCLYERTLRKGCGLASTYTHKRRPLNFCPGCGGKIIYSEFYQNARDYTIRKDGKVPKRYVSRSGELSESVAACENGCGVYWEDEEFSIGQDGTFYDNKYTEDGQT